MSTRYTERYYLCALSVSIFYDVSLLFSIAHKISVKNEMMFYMAFVPMSILIIDISKI